MKKGHGKLHWHLPCKGLKITYSAVSVSLLEPWARLQSWHQKRIMQFLYRGVGGRKSCFFFKTTACTDQTFHSAAFPYQAAVITNMEKLSRFSGKKHWGLKYIWSTNDYQTVKTVQNKDNTDNTSALESGYQDKDKLPCSFLPYCMDTQKFLLWCKNNILKQYAHMLLFNMLGMHDGVIWLLHLFILSIQVMICLK